MINLLALFSAILSIFGYFPQDISSASSQSGPNIGAMIQPTPRTAVMKDDNYFIWCGTMVEDKGTYHLFYSRWEKKYGFQAWVTRSEVAHAISKTPFGPFTFKDIALPARGSEYWDGLCTHNPTIHKFGSKYYLYYVGNTGDRDDTPGINGQLNWSHRNNQRIGVAVADSPNGPWKRFDKPIIDASENKDAPDALMASNPALTQGPDGKFLMVYKAVGKHKPMPFGGPVVHLTAWSDSPTGPFVKKLKPIFTAGEANFPAEDPFIWSQNGKYYAIVKDQGGYFIKHDTRALVLFESYNGEDWFLAPNGYITDVNLLWEDGEVERMAYLERPQLLFEKDKPTALLVAVGNKDMSETYNVQIPLASPNQNTSQLNVKDFHSPSDEYKPMTYYHWQNGHISKEGVKADIESMKDVGLGGFYLFNTAEGMPPGPVKYMSDEWWDVLQYTSEEAHRSGLQMGIMNGAGWGVSGSPWVKPEDSMQEVAWTEKHVTGPSVFEGSLDEPVPCLGFERDMQRDPIKNRRYYVPRDQLVGHYHDIAILAFPTPKGEKAGKPYHIDGWWKKAGYSLMPSWTIDENAAPDEETIQLDDIIDLTDSVTADGYLSWEVPEGDWTILRIGHQPTGKGNHPSVEGGRGLEVDKLSSKALDRYWETSPARMLKAAPKISKVLVDSYEAGYQNWTPGLEKEFERRMGYNPRRYLPAIAGRVITGTRDTERFLWDYRKVVSDLLIENFYNHFAALCHGTGTQFVIEPYGQFGNVDELSNGEAADILVGEFQAGERDGAFTKSTVKLSASLSHFYGKEIVGAESFTNSKLIFTLHPGMLKTQGDHYFCQGMNQLWLHTYVHDPYDKIPGMTLGTYGGHFNRRNTWWKYSKPWFDYLARCQYMLRQGRSKNDILYFMGEDAPARPPRTNELKPNIPSGYDYDLCGGSKCLSLLKVSKDGITAPSGNVYKLLVVKPQKYMRRPLLRQLLSLARQGAVIYMQAPEGTPGFDNDEAAVKKLSESVWKKSSGKYIKYGKGKIYPSGELEDILKGNGVCPDLEITFDDDFSPEKTQYQGNPVIYTHRTGSEEEIYFISNQQVHSPVDPIMVFNVKGLEPEEWNPMDGRIRLIEQYETTPDGRIKIKLHLNESGSTFIVFKKRSLPSGVNLAIASPRKEVLQLTNEWNVSLIPGFAGEGKSFKTKNLTNLSESNDPIVKYHSGEIVYRNTFEVHDIANRHFCLDLGDVAVLAQVEINGEEVGVLWCEPYRTDITGLIKEGKNELQIKIVNLLYNRLAGDLLLPEDCEWTPETGSTAKGYSLARVPQWVLDRKESPTGRKTFTSWRWPFMKEKELPPSGLIGPVRVFAY